MEKSSRMGACSKYSLINKPNSSPQNKFDMASIRVFSVVETIQNLAQFRDQLLAINSLHRYPPSLVNFFSKLNKKSAPKLNNAH